MRGNTLPAVASAMLLLGAVIAAPAQAQQRGMGTAADEARAVIDSAVSSFNAGNLDAYGKLFAPDVVSYTGVGGALRMEGKTAWLSWIQGAKQLYLSTTYDPRDVSYHSYNNDAVVVSGYYAFTSVSKSGEVATQTGRSSTVVAKVAGVWLVVSQHYSSMF